MKQRKTAVGKLAAGIGMELLLALVFTGCAGSGRAAQNTVPSVPAVEIQERVSAEENLSGGAAEGSDKSAAVVYRGETFQKSVFAAGGAMLYLYGIGPDGEYFLGGMQQEEDVFLAYDVDMGEGMRAFNMAVDGQGRCHILWMSVEAGELEGRHFDQITYEKSCITVIDSQGSLEKELDVTGIFSQKQGRPHCFAVDGEGRYYFENGRKVIQILSDGAQGQVREADGGIEAIGTGRSGEVFLILETQDGAEQLAKLEESGIVPCSAKLQEADVIYSGIYAGTDSELLLFNRTNGIWAWDGQEVQLRVPGSSLPVSGEKINGYGMLSDGRACILSQEDGETVFYYIPSGR